MRHKVFRGNANPLIDMGDREGREGDRTPAPRISDFLAQPLAHQRHG